MGGCLDIFSLVYRLFSFSLSLGDGPIQTEILPQRAFKPKTTNQPNVLEDLVCMVDILIVQCTAEEETDTNDVLATEELFILVCTDIVSCVPAPWVSGKLEEMHIQTFFPKI